jgi:hypothetical protein
MNSIFVLAPRGAAADSHRHLQALRSGCVLLTDSVPDSFFYSGAPAVRLRDWSQLASVVTRLRDAPSSVAALAHRSRWWWDNVCSERAVAEHMAAHLRALLALGR